MLKKDNTSEVQLLSQSTETQQKESREYVFDKTSGHVIRDGVTKYVIRWYGYLHQEDTVEVPHSLPNQIVVCYW